MAAPDRVALQHGGRRVDSRRRVGGAGERVVGRRPGFRSVTAALAERRLAGTGRGLPSHNGPMPRRRSTYAAATPDRMTRKVA
jgi:hypothetical protein